jgi:hypothetical protein
MMRGTHHPSISTACPGTVASAVIHNSDPGANHRPGGDVGSSGFMVVDDDEGFAA